MTYGTKLRERITAPGTTPLIGVYDMYSASITAQHYDAMFVSGFGFAASYYGLPDIGFIAWPDMMAFVQRLRGAFPGHHLLVDIDDGYVDPEVACHVVEGLERIGASGVILEDQKRPRRCGHADGKQVLPLAVLLVAAFLVPAQVRAVLDRPATEPTPGGGVGDPDGETALALLAGLSACLMILVGLTLLAHAVQVRRGGRVAA